MNETYEALTVKAEDSAVGVNLNVTAHYKEYGDGKSYDSIVKGAADVAENAHDNSPAFDLARFTDYDKMKDTLAMEVVSAEKNVAILETVPHMEKRHIGYAIVEMKSGSIIAFMNLMEKSLM
ncbi:hypothetical protein SAMN04487770_11747 [Butyrivibrio sp. ob235]|nr:hypothetical protein SAMN04487770_11747 [Butyrivibrio sp. ob235]